MVTVGVQNTDCSRDYQSHDYRVDRHEARRFDGG
jgi:hypothetical protein